MLLTEYFERCQEDGKRVETVVKEMLPQLKTMKPKEIVAELLWHVRQVFNTDERVTAVNAVEKILEFITVVVVTAGDIEKRSSKKKSTEDEVCNDTFERFASKLLEAKFLLCENAYVRKLCCQLFARLMAGLPSDTDVSEELFAQMSEAICDRLTDRSPGVRQAAARAAWRLQDPYADNCPVATALTVMAANDHHMGCRLAAVETIHIPTHMGTPAVIGRLADTCETVRRAALKRLAQRQDGTVISVRVLTPEHVRNVLARIVCEPSVKLRQSYAQQLVVSRWLDEDCRGDICSFLGLINIDTCRDLGRRTLQFIFASEPDRLEKIITAFTVPAFGSNGTTSTSLTPERVFTWTVLLDSVHARNRSSSTQTVDELFTRLLPANSDETGSESSKSFFVDYVFNFLEQLFDSPPSDDVELHSSMFIAEHLLTVLRHYCRALETAETDKIVTLLIDTLSRDRIHPHFVDLLTKTMCDLLGNGIPAVTRIAGVVSEMLDPDHNATSIAQQSARNKTREVTPPIPREDPNAIREAELRVASLRIRLNEMRDELDELVRLERYEDAALCRERIGVLKQELNEAIASKLNTATPVAAAKDEGASAENGDDEEIFSDDLGTQQLAKQRLDVIQQKPEIAVRLLSVLGACLEQCRPAMPVSNGLITELRSLFDDFVVTSIATPHPFVRAAALRVLGHCCCLDRDLAATFHSTFIVQMQIDSQTDYSVASFGEILDGPIAAIRMLTDIALRHGFEVFSSESEIATAIAHKLTSPDGAIQRAAGEALAQLLLSGRCPRKQVPALMARLVHFWFDADLAAGRDLDPHSELLRAVLAAFFRMYPTQSASSLAAFAESLLPTLRLADTGNVFSKLKPHAVAVFFGQKISPTSNSDLSADVHSQAATIQQSVALFLMAAVLESLGKLKQQEKEAKEKEATETEKKEHQGNDDENEGEERPVDDRSGDEGIDTEVESKPKSASLTKELLWYRAVAEATSSFIATINFGQNVKRSSRLTDLHSMASRLLHEQFEARLPSALVRRRCRRDIENFAKNLATAASIDETLANRFANSVTVTSAATTNNQENSLPEEVSIVAPSSANKLALNNTLAPILV